MDDDTGKMIVDDEDEDEEVGNNIEDIAGVAYREQMTSVEGFTRGTNGRVKFNKNTKKRRAAEDMEDVEMDDAPAATSPSKSKKREIVRLGQEFKAKVRYPSGFVLRSQILITLCRMLVEM
jgi:ribosomal RNA-processing protein 12